jgi:response regulator RpfG family c-di-GMP phosphodiesterase
MSTAVTTTGTGEKRRIGTNLAPTRTGGTTVTTRLGRTTIVRDSVKTVVILDTESTSTHPMEPVLERRGFAVLRAGTVEEAVGFLKDAGVAVDLVIAEVPLSGSTSQMQVVGLIQRSSAEIPILLISDLPLDRWPEDDFVHFGQLLSGRVDLLAKPLSQASFMAKANALIYTVSYRESKRLFEIASTRRAA